MESETDRDKENSVEQCDFDRMQLQVGARLQLVAQQGQHMVEHFSSLIGYLKDEYLLVKLPNKNNVLVGLLESEPVTVRVFSGTNVYFFNTRVARSFFSPYFFAHLDFPKLIYRKQIRGTHRIKVELEGTLLPQSDVDNPATLPVLLTNLSTGGAMIESDKPIARDSNRFLLSFSLFNQHYGREIPVQISSRIRSRKEQAGNVSGEAGVYHYGLQFDTVDHETQLALQNFTYETLLEARHRIM